MQYPEKLKNSIRGLFLVDFSNAINEQHYLIYKNGDLVIYPNSELKRQLNIKDLVDYSLQVMTIFDAMLDWSDGKEKPIGKKPIDQRTRMIDNVIKDLIKQVEGLDKKLDRIS